MVDSGNLAVFDFIREHGVILFTDIFAAFQHVLVSIVKDLDADNRIEKSVGIDLFLLRLHS